MKKTTLLTCLALTGVLGLSSTAYASEVSVQSLIDGSSQTEAENQPEAENEQTETETPSTENTDDTNTVSVQTENTEASGTAAQKSGETSSDGQVVPGTNMYDAGVIPFNTKISGTATEGVYNWYAFTTGPAAGTEYKITCVNTTPGADSIHYSLYDEYGSLITFNGFTALEACSDGVPSTMATNELDPNTTYYLQLITYDADPVDYILNVTDPNTPAPTSVPDSQNTLPPDGEVIAGTSQYNALLLPLNTKVFGTAEKDSYSWFSFNTGDSSGDEFRITAINNTPGADSIHYSLYDEYGSLITSNGFTALEACSDGVPSTMVTNELNPNTTYYLKLITYDANPIDYILDIQAPVKEDPKGSLVFEVPFEINETQVQFVINEATFIDEEKAKEALKPVADAILAHPDHSILLAGTTATDGTQESCVDLANRRCEAVKNLLVDTYGVPEAQLETIGLGYELDPFERGQDRDANGNFVESEGRKNRRVVVLDAEDPIAQELMKLK